MILRIDAIFGVCFHFFKSRIVLHDIDLDQHCLCSVERKQLKCPCLVDTFLMPCFYCPSWPCCTQCLLLVLLLVAAAAVVLLSCCSYQTASKARNNCCCCCCAYKDTAPAGRGNTMALKDERGPKYAFSGAGTSLLKSPRKSLLLN